MKINKAIIILFFLILSCKQKEKIPSHIDVYFAYPGVNKVEDDQPKQTIINLINSVDKNDTLFIAMYCFTDDDIGEAIIRAKNRGTFVEVYLEESQLKSTGSEIHKLISSGINIFVSNYKSGLMHHKFAVINSEIVITGSYNWTASADKHNFENLLVIKDKNIGQKYKSAFINMINNYAYNKNILLPNSSKKYF